MNLRRDIYNEIITKLIHNETVTPAKLGFVKYIPNPNEPGRTMSIPFEIADLEIQKDSKEYTDDAILYQASELYNKIIFILCLNEEEPKLEIIYPSNLLSQQNINILNTNLNNIDIHNFNNNNSIFLLKENAHFITYKRLTKNPIKAKDIFYRYIIQILNENDSEGNKKYIRMFNEYFNVINIAINLNNDPLNLFKDSLPKSKVVPRPVPRGKSVIPKPVPTLVPKQNAINLLPELNNETKQLIYGTTNLTTAQLKEANYSSKVNQESPNGKNTKKIRPAPKPKVSSKLRARIRSPNQHTKSKTSGNAFIKSARQLLTRKIKGIGSII